MARYVGLVEEVAKVHPDDLFARHRPNARDRVIDVEHVAGRAKDHDDVGIVLEERAKALLALDQRILRGKRLGQILGVGKRPVRSERANREGRPAEGASHSVGASDATDVRERTMFLERGDAIEHILQSVAIGGCDEGEIRRALSEHARASTPNASAARADQNAIRLSSSHATMARGERESRSSRSRRSRSSSIGSLMRQILEEAVDAALAAES